MAASWAGAFLLNYCEQNIYDKHVNIIVSKVLKKSSWAINFYLKNDYKIYDQKQDSALLQNIASLYPEKPWSVFMYKELK